MTPRRAPVGIVRAEAPSAKATPSQTPMALAGSAGLERLGELVGDPGRDPERGTAEDRRRRTRRPPGSRAAGRIARSGAGDGLDDIGSRPGPRREPAGRLVRRATKTGSRPSRTASDAATKPSNSGCGRSGRDLNSGWNWLATNHGWSLQLDDLDQPAVGRLAGQHHAGRLERLAVAVVDLEAVAMALVDDLLAVDRGRLRAGRQLGRVEAEAHRAALVLHVALVGHEVDDRVLGEHVELGRVGVARCRRPRGRTR